MAREDARLYRLRLYKEGDERFPDEVSLVMEALETQLEMAMAGGDKARVRDLSRIAERMRDGLGEDYFGEAPGEAAVTAAGGE